MTTPSDLKAALVEAMSLAACANNCADAREDGQCETGCSRPDTLILFRNDMACALASLPPVLERFGCKVLWGGPTLAMQRINGSANFAAMHDAAPTVPWEE